MNANYEITHDFERKKYLNKDEVSLTLIAHFKEEKQTRKAESFSLASDLGNLG
jgi:hypothetical protein